MKEVFLIVIISWGGSEDVFAYKVPSIVVCQQQVAQARVTVPPGAEQEHAVVMFCSKNKGLKRYSVSDGTVWK